MTPAVWRRDLTPYLVWIAAEVGAIHCFIKKRGGSESKWQWKLDKQAATLKTALWKLREKREVALLDQDKEKARTAAREHPVPLIVIDQTALKLEYALFLIVDCTVPPSIFACHGPATRWSCICSSAASRALPTSCSFAKRGRPRSRRSRGPASGSSSLPSAQDGVRIGLCACLQ